MNKDSSTTRCLRNASKMTNKHCGTFDDIVKEMSVKNIITLKDPTQSQHNFISRSLRDVSAKASRYFNSYVYLCPSETNVIIPDFYNLLPFLNDMPCCVLYSYVY